MHVEMATDVNKPQDDYAANKKCFTNSNNNIRRKPKQPKNQRLLNYDSNASRASAYNVIVITTGPNGSAASVEAEEGEGDGCPDDNASVCSSQSSGASEHSVGASKKAKKVRRVRCEMHSRKSRNESSLAEEPEESSRAAEEETDLKEDGRRPLVCTCSKLKTRIRRPEPEGSFVPGGKGMAGSVVMSELDRILCSNEPLFSDCELEKEPEQSRDGETQTRQRQQAAAKKTSVVNEQVKQESDRFHRRMEQSAGGGTNLETAFCVQMLNTNTSIKFAILQTELKNIKDRSLKRVEADVTAICEKFASMQELVEGSVESLSSFAQQVQQTSKIVNARMEKERKEEKELINSYIDLDVASLSSKQDFCSSDLDVANNRLSYLERTRAAIEAEIKSLGSTDSNETSRLKERLNEVQSDMTSTEKIFVHISSCLHCR